MKKSITYIFAGLLILAGCSMGGGDKSNTSDSGRIIYNPDMGFYSAIKVKIARDGTITNRNEVNEEINHTADKVTSYKDSYHFNLVHLKVDLSAFSGRVNETGKDVELESTHLSELGEVLSELKNKEKTTVIRFAYDPDYDNKLVSYQDGEKTYKACEPLNFDNVLGAVDIICNLLKDHLEVITAIECGMLGPWGEMHTTYYAESAKDNITRGYIVEIIKHFMDGLDGYDVPLLVRQPKFIYCYLNQNTPNYDDRFIPDVSYNNSLKRLGIYNDGYLNEENDSGTFVTQNGRSAEINFLEPYTDHTPYGGELIGTYGLKNGITQLQNVHLSFLNIGWNSEILKKLDSSAYTWHGETMFKYILKHMGYRYILTDYSFNEINNTLTVNLSFRNDGFANLPYHRKKKVWLYFIEEGTEITENEAPVKTSALFTGQKDINFTANISSLDSGTYTVYAKFCNSDGKYAIQFANDGWNESLKANRIGTYTK